jgi:hypothetical protein
MTAPASEMSPILREAKTGGRWAPRTPAVGDSGSGSTVLRDLGVDEKGHRRFEITCGRCQAPQTRNSGQINFAFRKGFPVTCPRCMAEGYVARLLQHSDIITERVLGGGPIYTAWETDDMCKDILAELEEEFGPMRHPEDELQPSDMRIGAGFPYSHDDIKSARSGLKRFLAEPKIDLEWIQIMTRERAATEEREYQEALKRAKKLAEKQAKKRERDIRIALKQHHLRDERQFRERAGVAAEALADLIRVGGSVYTEDEVP